MLNGCQFTMYRKNFKCLIVKGVDGFVGKNKHTEATFQTGPFHLHKLDESPTVTTKLNKEDATRYYNQLFTIRRLEAKAGELYKEKLVRGFCHLYVGEEAVAVGIKAVMRPQDCVITAYRAHGWTYLMGVSVHSVLSELIGKRSGCARGKGGSMHMYAKNFYGGNGIVGGHVPLGTGIAFAAKYKGTDGVCFTAYGDGAANQGQVAESFNIAKLWNLPVIYVCENNNYAMGTKTSRASASTHFYTRGDYIPGLWVDGMDILSVREATKFALNYVNSGKGPIIMECATYRYSGHSMSDPGTSYRTREEVQHVRQTHDPITMFKEKLTSSELMSTDELKKVEDDVKAIVEAATIQAKGEKVVDLDELTSDIYADNISAKIRSVNPFKPLSHKLTSWKPEVQAK